MSEQKCLVCVVDDNEMEPGMLRQWLEDAGIETAGYTSGSDFVFNAPADRPLVAILDMQMPTPGPKTFDIMQIRGLSWVPVIFCTHSGDIDMMAAMYAKGAMGFMSKAPANKELLVELIHSAMERAVVTYFGGGKKEKFGVLTLSEPELALLDAYFKDGIILGAEQAKAIGKSPGSISHYKASIYGKLSRGVAKNFEQLRRMYNGVDFRKLHAAALKAKEVRDVASGKI